MHLCFNKRSASTRKLSSAVSDLFGLNHPRHQVACTKARSARTPKTSNFSIWSPYSSPNGSPRFKSGTSSKYLELKAKATLQQSWGPSNKHEAVALNKSEFLLTVPALSPVVRTDWNEARAADRLKQPCTLFKYSEPLPYDPIDTQGTMKSDLQILVTPTADSTGTTLVLRTESKRYLFGSLGEGICRTVAELSTSFKNVTDVFVSGRSDWKNLGGMMGLIITVGDQMKAQERDAEYAARRSGVGGSNELALRVHGPRNLAYTVATCRRFVFRSRLPLRIDEISGATTLQSHDKEIKPAFVDESLRVYAMSIAPSSAADEVSENQRNVRKRSYDQLMGWDEPKTDKEADEREDQYSTLTKAVLNDMFFSDWRLDALYETPLSEVQMPAKIFIRDPKTKDIMNYTGPLPGSGEDLPELTVLVRKPWPASLIPALPPTKRVQEAVSYIVTGQQVRGRFDKDKAIALGLKKAWERTGDATEDARRKLEASDNLRKWGQLSKGEAVSNSEGVLIQPEDVLGPPRNGAGFALVDLPDASYIPALTARPEWNSKEVMGSVAVIIWTLSPGVLSNPDLESFMEKLRKLYNVKHIISSPDVCSNDINFSSAAALNLGLSQLDPMRFVGPCGDSLVQKHPQTATPHFRLSEGAMPAQQGMEIALLPAFEINRRAVIPTIKPNNILDQMPQRLYELVGEVEGIASEMKDEDEAWRSEIPDPDTQIYPLGTSSAAPTKYRSVSGTLIRIPGRGSYILDCGENTLGQIQRLFGPEDTRKILQDLRCIWISHLHADHHLGTTSILKAWYNAVHGGKPPTAAALEDPAKKLAVIAAEHMLDWLYEYSCVEDFGWGAFTPVQITSEQDITPENPHNLHLRTSPSSLVPLKDLSDFGIETLKAVSVSHCIGAKAVSMTFPSGLKISYSGDCRPSKSFAEIGQGTTLLIHEATFDDQYAGMAIAKKHSTIGEAFAIGQMMKAKAVLLTHFSARYRKFPSARPEENPDIQNAILEEEENLGDQNLDVAEAEDIVEDDNASAAAAATSNGDNTNKTAASSRNRAPSRASSNGASRPLAKTFNTGKTSGSDMRVGIAFDQMRIRLGDFCELEHFLPAMQMVIEEGWMDGLVEKAQSRKAVKGSSGTLESGMAMQEVKEIQMRRAAETVRLIRPNAES